MRFKSILCPVDRSAISKRAVAYATALAHEYVAKLDVVEVLEWTLPPGISPKDDLLEVHSEIALENLNDLCKPARDLGIVTEVAVETGPVVPTILARARERRSDLIVAGTHGRSGFDRLVLGSVAEKILRKARCPVLAVPQRAPTPRDGQVFRTILCAVDFSRASKDAFRVAADFARRYGSRLIALHVVPWPFDKPPGRTAKAARDFKGSLEARARSELARLVDAEPAPPGNVFTMVLAGAPQDQILRCARRLRADLVVLGVSGHGAIDRVVLGSTAHGVVRRSSCAVLTVRARAVNRRTS